MKRFKVKLLCSTVSSLPSTFNVPRLPRVPVFLRSLFIFFVFWAHPSRAAENWEEIKGKHFVVYFYPLRNREIADTVLRRAEDYYQKVGSQIGYTRYYNFWTWDERVRIVLFPDQQSFVERTGQPAWAGGYSVRDSYLFQSRTIVTYYQESNFYDELLPHEISHLILRDFTSNRIPIWFEEGVAQLHEKSKTQVAAQTMKALIKHRQYIPLAILMSWDIRKEQDSHKVQIFYMESLSIVEYLLKNYGSTAFGKLCHHLKDGKTFEEALRGTYTNNINTIEDLESKWITSMSQ